MTKMERFYKSAILEDEGFGTAYEYMMKDSLMKRFLPRTINSVLLPGIPEKYGYALNALILVDGLAKEILVVEDRPQRLDRFNKILDNAVKYGLIKHPKNIGTKLVSNIQEYLPEKKYSLIISMEVIQRIAENEQQEYLNRLINWADLTFLFSPNRYHEAHRTITHLETIEPKETAQKVDNNIAKVLDYGFVDCPPFSSGITLSKEQREIGSNSSSGLIKKIILKTMLFILFLATKFEGFLPAGRRKKNSHIAYVIIKANS